MVTHTTPFKIVHAFPHSHLSNSKAVLYFYFLLILLWKQLPDKKNSWIYCTEPGPGKRFT